MTAPLQIVPVGDTAALLTKAENGEVITRTLRTPNSIPCFVLTSENPTDPLQAGYMLLVEGSLDNVDYFNLLDITVLPESRGTSYANQSARVNYIRASVALPAPDAGEIINLMVLA